MRKIDTGFDGLFIIETDFHQDLRGGFKKIVFEPFYRDNGLEYDFKEAYYSINRKGVIRGMHFQNPPADHAKVVYVSNGSIVDVVVDLRKNKPTFKKFFVFEMCSDSPYFLYIPRGFAHGFLSLEDNTICNYLQTSVYSQADDSGIDAMSFGYDWGIECPIRSGRDLTFPKIDDFETPFK